MIIQTPYGDYAMYKLYSRINSYLHWTSRPLVPPLVRSRQSAAEDCRIVDSYSLEYPVRAHDKSISLVVQVEPFQIRNSRGVPRSVLATG